MSEQILPMEEIKNSCNCTEDTCSCKNQEEPSTETTSQKCAFSLPKLSVKDKKQFVKHAMVASLAVTALSGFLPVRYSKKVHTIAGLSFIGLATLHTIQNSPKKK